MIQHFLATGSWDKPGAKVLNVGTSAHPVTKMLAVSPDKIWCSVHSCVKIIDTAALEVEVSALHISVTIFVVLVEV